MSDTSKALDDMEEKIGDLDVSDEVRQVLLGLVGIIQRQEQRIAGLEDRVDEIEEGGETEEDDEDEEE